MLIELSDTRSSSHLAEHLAKLKAAVAAVYRARSHRACVALCAITRTVWNKLETEGFLNPQSRIEIKERFLPIFRSANDAMASVLSQPNTKIAGGDRMSIERMASNIQHRVRKLEVLTGEGPPAGAVDEDIFHHKEDIFAQIRSIGRAMVEAQRALRTKHAATRQEEVSK